MASAFKRGGIWYARFHGVDGWTQKAVGRDKAEAERISGALEVDAKWRREGLVDPKADGFAAAERRSVAEHLADFKADILARRANEAYATQTHQRAERMLVGVESLSAIGPVGVNERVRTLRDVEEHGKASIAHHLRAVKAFTRWLMRNGRTRDDALIAVRVPGAVAKSERVRVRRALSVAEFEKLVTHTVKAGMLEGMSGADRAMLYRLAAGTGFRQGELRSLTPVCFDLEADEPTVTVTAAYSKRKRDDRQPIAPELAVVVGPWLATKAAGRAVFSLPERTKIAEMLRTDAAAARAVWLGEVEGKAQAERAKTTFLASEDASGAVLDFHGLRVSYISWLVESGASVKTCQELARHSTPVLTIGCYARMSLHDQGRALAGLPVGGAKPVSDEAAEMKATGTYGDSRNTSAARVQQTQGNSRGLKITPDGSEGGSGGVKNPLYSSAQTLDNPMAIGQNVGPSLDGEIGIRSGLKILWSEMTVRVRPPLQAVENPETVGSCAEVLKRSGMESKKQSRPLRTGTASVIIIISIIPI